MKGEKIYNKIKPFSYAVGKLGSFIYSKFFLRLKVLKNEIKKDGRKKVLISNHQSVIDFMVIMNAVKGPCHLVTSNAFLRTLPIKKLVENYGVIGKNQFQTIPSDLRKMKAIVDDYKTLALFPAGLMTESGASSPIPPATAKTLKWFNADIYVAKIRGTYLSKPKWSKVFRKGRTTVEIYKLATAEEFSTLSKEDAVRLIDAHLSFDAYRESVQDKISHKHGDNVVGLENVVYKCPSCNGEHTIHSKDKNVLTCSACGYSVQCNKYGIMHQYGDKPIVYPFVSDWYKFIENAVFEKVKNEPNFVFKTVAEVHKINDKKHKFESVGNAEITLDNEKFTLRGTLYGESVEKVIYARNFPSLPFVPGLRFEIQDGTDIFRIYPENPKIVTEWILTVKALFKLYHE